MSTIPDPAVSPSQPLRVRSVVGLAYDEIRAQIVAGALPAGARLGQGELADRLGISRGSVREALRRLAGDGLVEFEVNRGFFVADTHLDDVRHRLEARLVLEPGIARLAAERRTDADLAALRATIDAEEAGGTSDEVHDASRAFHLALAAATGNPAFTKLLDGLWIADIGRRLLAQRRRVGDWQDHDVDEHRAIVEAIAAGDGDRSAELMRAHVGDAVRHWAPQPPG